jgi:hypothetical protein
MKGVGGERRDERGNTRVNALNQNLHPFQVSCEGVKGRIFWEWTKLVLPSICSMVLKY